MGGLGLDAIGEFPCGFALPETVTAPPSAPEQARYIDFLTRDYMIADDGELARMPITRQRVLLALSTLMGSATVMPNYGVKLPGIINEQDEAGVRNAVRQALQFLLNEGAITLKSVMVNSSTVVGRSIIQVEYVDTATLDSDRVEI